MSGPQPRLRTALLLGAVLVTGTPVVATALAPHLQCGVTQTGRWERLPVPAFKAISGIGASTRDTLTAYSVDRTRPQNVVATNGYRVQLSRSHGCAWHDAYALSPAPTTNQPFAGAAASIVSVAALDGRTLVAVQEGSGAASRPHVMVSLDGTTFRASDNGLPAQGAPRLLRAAGDGRTSYLTISPTATDGGGLPGVPLPGGTTTPTGLLYRTVDGGASWTLQTGAGDLANGGAGFSQLDIDPQNTNRLYGIVGGQLVTSADGGATFRQGPAGQYTAVTAMGPSQVAAFTAGGLAYVSTDGGRRYSQFSAPRGVTSAAFRSESTYLVVESSGTLRMLEPGGAAVPIPAAAPAKPGSLLGDRGTQSSIHALSGHSLLRYVDPIPKGTVIPPVAVGDLSVPPPSPGTVLPGVRNLSLPIGTGAVADFTLNLPKNPTPLDLFFLVDVSTGMDSVIDDVKKNLSRIVSSLKAANVNFKVGVGTVGTGPARGEDPYPDAYVYPPVVDRGDPSKSHPDPRRYEKPSLYKRIRSVGATDASLTQAINQLRLETTPSGATQNHEGQLIALQNLAEGRGVQTEQEDTYNLPSISAVPPGQQANFRPNPGVRRIVILASNEAFDEPYGTDHYPDSDPVNGNPHLDFRKTIAILQRNRIQVMGLTAGQDVAAPDLRKIAGGSHMYAPAGGLDCDGDQHLAAGEPLVCNNGTLFSDVIIRVLASLVDRQNVQVVPANRTPVLGALDAHALLGLDVKKPNSAVFSVRVSCVGVAPGSYGQDVQALLRQTVVGHARVNVTCVKAAAITPPKPVTLAGNPPPPPPQPGANLVAPVAAPAPAAQPQANPQIQTQIQVQPLTAAAIQEQQELQLALALSGLLKDDDPVFNPNQQLAMVDRRKREEVQALGVLAFALTACAGLGLARLRARPEVQARRVTR